MDKIKEIWSKLPQSGKVFAMFVGAVIVLELISRIPT